MYDKDGKLIDVNQKTLDIYGLKDKQQLIGYEIWASPYLTAEQAKALKSGKPIFTPGYLDFDEANKSGLFHTEKTGIIYVELYTIPLMREKEIIGYLAHMLDVTDRKKMEEQLLQTRKMESIGRLAGGIAHDFNNILMPIIGYVDLAMMDLSPDEELYTNLKYVQEAADRATGLTRQILAFSRKQVMQMHEIDLNKIVANFKKMLHRLIGEDIELKTSLEPALCRIKADAGQIEQVLMNLAINARDAMPNGGRLTIETTNVYLDEGNMNSHAGEQAAGHYAKLAVSDNGCGMPQETQQQIFEPFFTTKKLGKGTGLGLSTVFGIIKQHSGNIWVYSEPGKGTTFKIYLPKVEGANSPIQLSEEKAARNAYNGTETILVVEDEVMVRQLVCKTLKARGYTVLQAEGPKKALQLFSEYKTTLHLLLTDVIMPEMNGKELYQKIVTMAPEIKVLYISGYTDNIIGHDGILGENVNFLQKPFSVKSLSKKVRAVLDQK